MPLNAQKSWRQAVRSLRGGLAAALVFSFALNLLMLAVPLYSMQLYDRVLGSGHVETLVLLSLIAGAGARGAGRFRDGAQQPARAHASRFEQSLRRPVVEAAARPTAPAPPGCATWRSCAQPSPARPCRPVRCPLAAAGAARHLDPAPAAGVFAAASAVVLALLAVANDLLTRRPQRLAGPQPARGADAGRSAGSQGRGRAGHGHGRRPGAAHRPAARRLADRAAERRRARRRRDGRDPRPAARRSRPASWVSAPGWCCATSSPRAPCSPARSWSARRWRRSSRWSAPGRRWAAARESWGRLRDLLAAEARRPTGVSLPAPLGRLAVEAATVRGRTAACSCTSVSFALEPGECLAVVGPSGAGKSTLCRLLTGVAAPADGRRPARWRASSSTTRPPSSAATSATCRRSAMLFAGTVAENIARMAEAPDSGGSRRGGTAGRRARDDPAPARGLRDPARPTAARRCRAASGNGSASPAPSTATRAWSCSTSPTRISTAAGEAALMAALGRLKEAGATIVVVTHRPQALQRADKVLVLEDGASAASAHATRVLPGPVRPVRAA